MDMVNNKQISVSQCPKPPYLADNPRKRHYTHSPGK